MSEHDNPTGRALTILEGSAEYVCFATCPSVWKTADGPPPHDRECRDAHQAVVTVADEIARLRAELAAERRRLDWVESHFDAIGEWADDDDPPAPTRWCVENADGSGGRIAGTLRGLADGATEGDR